MAAPVLNAYQYQYKDSGVLLNGNPSLPFIDVKKVAGLDLPDIDATVTEYDSQHGGFVNAKYVATRTIVIEGMLYADPTTVDVTIDALTTNFIPDDTDYPFYFRGAGIAQRYILAKSVGFKYDVETLRAFGASQIQIILQAGDPRKYVDNANQTMTATTDYNVQNLGNINTFPVFTITGAFTSLTLTNITTSKSVVLTTTRIAGDVTVVDFKNKSVTINGVRNSAVAAAANGWWDIAANGTTAVEFTVVGGPPTTVVMATKQGWL